MSEITANGNGVANSSTRSTRPLAARSSTRRSTTVSTSPVICSTIFGVNARLTRPRSRLWSGSSLNTMLSVRRRNIRGRYLIIGAGAAVLDDVAREPLVVCTVITSSYRVSRYPPPPRMSWRDFTRESGAVARNRAYRGNGSENMTGSDRSVTSRRATAALMRPRSPRGRSPAGLKDPFVMELFLSTRRDRVPGSWSLILWHTMPRRDTLPGVHVAQGARLAATDGRHER